MSAVFTAPAIAGAAALLKLGDAHDGMLDTIRAGTGATGDELLKLDKIGLAVFSSIPTSMELTGTALTEISRLSGATGKDLENLTKVQLELARVTGTDLAGNVQSTQKAFNNWGVSVQDQTKYLDGLYRTTEQTGVPVATLADQLSQYGPILRQMGFSLEDSIALLGTMGKAGLDTGQLVTGLRTAFKKFGEQGLTDTNAALSNVFTQIKNAPDALKAGGIALDYFGSKAGPALADSIRAGRLEYSDLLEIVKNGDETILDAAASTNDWRENLQILTNRMSVKLLPIADKVFASLNDYGIPALEKISDVVETAAAMFDKMPRGLKQAAGAFGILLVAAGPILVLLGTIMSAIAPALPLIAGLVGPWGLVIAAVVLFGVVWKKNLFGIQEKLAPIIDTVKLLGRYFYDVATNKIQPGNLAKLPKWLQPIAWVLGRVIKTLRVFVKTWQDKGLLAALKTIPVQIRAFGRAVANLAESMGLTRTAKMIRETFTTIAKLVSDVISLVDNLIHGRWSQVWQDLGSIALDLVHLFVGRFKLLGALLLDVFNLIPWSRIGSALFDGLVRAGTFMQETGYPWLWAKALELFGALLTGAEGVWTDTLEPWFGELGGKITGVIDLAQNAIYDKGRDLFGWIWSGIASLLGWFEMQFHAIPNLAISVISQFANYFYNAGRDIVSGLWTGISSLGGWLYDQVSAFAYDNTIGAFKKKLGIESPSKVFMNAGMQIPLGVALGISKTAGAASSAASSMLSNLSSVSGLTPALAGMPAVANAGNANASSMRGPITVQLTVHSNDGRKFARELMTELDRIDRGES